MSRRRNKKSDTAAAMFLIAISIVVAVIYFSSVFYGLAIVFPFLYYNVVKAGELNKNGAAFIQAREACISLQSKINDVWDSNADLRKTQRGDFDERSNRGATANKIIAQSELSYSQYEAALQSYIGIYKSAMFYRYAVIVYIFSLFALSYFKVELSVIPVVAAIISLFGGFVGRCSVNDALSYKELPQLDIKPSLITSVVWLVACINYYPSILQQASDNLNSINSTASLQQSMPGAEKSSEKDTENEEPSSAASSQVSPIDNKRAFLTRAVIARSSLQAGAAAGTPLPGGKEVLITGVSADQKWYEILYDGSTETLYVPSDSVGVFSE